MATNKQNDVSKAVQQTKKAVSPSYSVDEYASAPESLGTTSDIIRAAFKTVGKDIATVEEAKEIINKFKLKEVK